MLLEMRVADWSLRTHALHTLLRMGLDAETHAERDLINAILRNVVLPDRFATVDMLRAALAPLMEAFSEIEEDLPKAGAYFGAMLTGLFPAVLSADDVVPAIATALRLAPAAAAPAPARAAAAAAAAPAPAPAAAAAAAAPAAAPAPAAPAPAPAAAPAPEAAAAAAAGGDEDGEFTAAKKKKKKAAVTFD